LRGEGNRNIHPRQWINTEPCSTKVKLHVTVLTFTVNPRLRRSRSLAAGTKLWCQNLIALSNHSSTAWIWQLYMSWICCFNTGL